MLTYLYSLVTPLTGSPYFVAFVVIGGRSVLSVAQLRHQCVLPFMLAMANIDGFDGLITGGEGWCRW